MPDPLEMLKAAAAAGAVAAAIALLLGWPGRTRPWLGSLGGILGLAMGLGVGLWLLRVPPAWPPAQARDRLLLVLLPVAALVECLAAAPRLRPWFRWTLRALPAMVAARVLLHGSIWLVEGPFSTPWQPAEAAKWFVVLGALALALVLQLTVLASRPQGRSVPLVLGLAAGAAGVAVMYSAGATDGQLGVPLSAALIGIAAAGWIVRQHAAAVSAVAVGSLALAGLLLIGCGFAKLTPSHALLLLAAPALAWLTESPPIARLRSWARVLARVAVVTIPLGIVVVQAKQAFDRAEAETGTSEDANGGGSDYGY